jgi:hypothetical protein
MLDTAVSPYHESLPRIVYDLPNADYQRDWPSLSASGTAKIIDTCPARFKWDIDHPGEDTETPAKRIGSLVHAWTLEGDGAVRQRYYCLPEDHSNQTKAGKELRAEIVESGMIPIKYEEFVTARDMSLEIKKHPIYRLFEAGHPEVSLFWRVPKEEAGAGIVCRARLDWLPDARGLGEIWDQVIPDLKSTLSADPRHLKKAMYDFNYYVQAAHYLDGIVACGVRERPIFRFICQEKEAPYFVTVVELDDEALDLGRKAIAKARDIFKRGLETGVWPQYASQVVKLSLPKYAFANENL